MKTLGVQPVCHSRQIIRVACGACAYKFSPHDAWHLLVEQYVGRAPHAGNDVDKAPSRDSFVARLVRLVQDFSSMAPRLNKEITIEDDVHPHDDSIDHCGGESRSCGKLAASREAQLKRCVSFWSLI